MNIVSNPDTLISGGCQVTQVLNTTFEATMEVTVRLPTLRGKVLNPPISGDGDAAISGRQFTFQVEVIDPSSNQRATSFNGEVTMRLLNPGFVSGETISPNPVTISHGVGTTQVIIRVVGGTDRGRNYDLRASIGSYRIAKSDYINVWFSVIATREGLVGGRTACGHTIVENDGFVALPSTGLCDKQIKLRNGSITLATSVLDVGPWFPHSSPWPGNPCLGPNDPYWNNTGIPATEATSCDSNDAGIDLGDGTFGDLGLVNPTRILWRFN